MNHRPVAQLHERSRGRRHRSGGHHATFYVKHLLCAVVDNHFSSRLTGTGDSDRLTVTVGELLHALREAFELGQSVRGPK